VIATVLAGGALAAAGQAALGHSLPLASDRVEVLKLGVQELLGTPTPDGTVPLVGLSPVGSPVGAPGVIGATSVPRPVDVGGLVKATDLHGRAAQAARPATATAQSAPPAPVTAPPAPAPTPAAAEVQMVSGRVTSGFGMRWGRLHRGLDVAAPVGTPIHAPLAGEVIASGPASGFGLWVRVRHDDGTVTTYGHVNHTGTSTTRWYASASTSMPARRSPRSATAVTRRARTCTSRCRPRAGPRSTRGVGSTRTTSPTEARPEPVGQPDAIGSARDPSAAGGSSMTPLVNMFTARILFVTSSAATLYASESVG
jgi:hypothetical protein